MPPRRYYPNGYFNTGSEQLDLTRILEDVILRSTAMALEQHAPTYGHWEKAASISALATSLVGVAFDGASEGNIDKHIEGLMGVMQHAINDFVQMRNFRGRFGVEFEHKYPAPPEEMQAGAIYHEGKFQVVDRDTLAEMLGGEEVLDKIIASVLTRTDKPRQEDPFAGLHGIIVCRKCEGGKEVDGVECDNCKGQGSIPLVRPTGNGAN